MSSVVALWGCGSSVSDSADAGEVADVDADVGDDIDAAIPSDAPTVAAEICNGIDDDGNGKVDDIDVGGDGICDCLRIATIGIPGVWGDGDVFSQWLENKSDNGIVELTPEGEDPEITSEMLAGFQVIVVQDASVLDAFSQSEIDAVANWVSTGGGLMTLIGYGNPTERTNVNALLAPMQLSYAEAQILGGSPTVPVDDSWAEHPISNAVTAVGVDNGYPVVDGDAQGTVVAQEGGHVVAVAKTFGDGKVFVWGDEWITYNTEWGETEYQVEQFWLNSINWLTPQLACEIDVIIVD